MTLPLLYFFSPLLMSFIQLENPFPAKASHHGDPLDSNPLPVAESCSGFACKVPSRLARRHLLYA